MAHHGKGARLRAREKRAAAKSAKRALYASLVGKASNKKKKGDAASGKNWSVAKIEVSIFDKLGKRIILKFHGGSECGNIGCRRCNG